MIGKVRSQVVIGVDARRVDIEVDAYKALQPAFHIVGMPDQAIKESANRIRSALMASGHALHENKIVINLAPADLKKEGASLDLPMAVGLLMAAGRVGPERLRELSIVGELGLDGAVRPVRGALSLAMGAREEGLRGLVLPEANALEAAVIQGIEVYPVRNLMQLLGFLTGEEMLLPQKADPQALFEQASAREVQDFSEVKGQATAKRALEIAAAGGHNVLMLGSPGGGKTMLARRLPGILPRMSLEESLETTRVHSIAGELDGQAALVATRPFRAPHHTVSTAALVGGGSMPRPGEISLAHNGVLFLDEIAELSRATLEVLRQPMEDGHVTVSRAAMTLRFPARFLLCAAMNPCPCGYLMDERRDCRCNPGQIQKYRSRLSGPLMDRIDLHVEVPAVPYRELSRASDGEPSEAIRRRVEAARERQTRRFADRPGLHCNAHMGPRELRKHCRLDEAGKALLGHAMDRLGLSARSHDRILKLARSIADLAGEPEIREAQLAEAIQYRSLDRAQHPAREQQP